MQQASVLVKLADATSSLEITDAVLGASFLKNYADHLARGNGHAVSAVLRIGERALGGVYAGICRGSDGKPDHHLVVHADEKDSIKWQDAIDWAKTLEADGHKDFTLPTRKEQAVLFGNVPELFQPKWYWSGETHAASSAYAWVQDFRNGGQYYYRKDFTGRARAVRRVAI